MVHEHTHEVSNYNRSFAIGVSLNIVFVVLEVVYGLMADSLALITDAGHNLSDVIGLMLAWGASVLATKAATKKLTYGLRKTTIMASLASGILLLVAIGGIAWEGAMRFFDPVPVEGMTVIIVAGVGVVINSVTALLFIKGQKHDLNIRGAFLHMAADAAVSLGVVIAGAVILAKGWLWIDPMVSLVIAVVIFIGTWGLLRDSFNYAIDAVPQSIDVPSIEHYLMSLDRVLRIHDLHVWPLSTTEVALTVHLVVNDDKLDNSFLSQLQGYLHDHFGIEHATIQIEAYDIDNQCLLDKDKCV